MRPTRPSPLLATGVLAAVLAWAGLRIVVARGGSEPQLVWTTGVTVALLAVAVVAVGWPVRQWVRGDKARRIDALRAARTAALAKAASMLGALFVGLYTGYVVHLVPTAQVAARGSQLLLAAATLVVSAALLVAGLVVERWCRVPEDDDEPGGGAAPA